ncbi:hypothetical protein Ct61P_09861 [Colletotrichum tofieldiae]|nr:hypothetical protein Ct61P_09861 [Colletotrichum tofieldiae]
MPSSNNYTYKSSGTNKQVPNPIAPLKLASSPWVLSWDRGNLLRGKGNHYCARDYGSSSSNPNSYHYSNTMRLMGFTGSNGSFHYSNPNGSTYSNNGNGGSTYTSASGYRTSSGYGKK